MATDQSDLLPGGPVNALVPTSQSDGGEPHDNSHAMTAGALPSLNVTRLAGETDTHPAPDVDTDARDPRQLVQGKPGGSAAGRWETAGGSAWGPGRQGQ
jgi:hypothetical protein